MYAVVHNDFLIIWSSCLLIITRRVSLVEQELLNFPKHQFLVHGIRIVHSLVFCVVFCRSLSLCSISLCHCIVYPSSTCNSNNLFGTVKLFVDYLSRIDLWDEMWITSTRMVIREKILINSNRMNLYCMGWSRCNNLYVKEDIFDRVVPFCIVACIPLNISLLTCYCSGLLQGVWYFPNSGHK
jgi:hypothetical protein